MKGKRIQLKTKRLIILNTKERKNISEKVVENTMAFNGGAVGGGGGGGGGGAGGASGGDGPLNKRLCTGKDASRSYTDKENNEAGLNNNRVSCSFFLPFHCFSMPVSVRL